MLIGIEPPKGVADYLALGAIARKEKRLRQRSARTHVGAFSARLSFATANVSTLHPADFRSAGMDVLGVGRIAALEEQFASAAIDILGIQEGRLPGDGEDTSLHYTMLRARADAHGSFGV